MKLLYKHIKGYCILLSPRQSNISPQAWYYASDNANCLGGRWNQSIQWTSSEFQSLGCLLQLASESLCKYHQISVLRAHGFAFSHRAMLTQGFGWRGQNEYWWTNLNDLAWLCVSHQKMEVVKCVYAPLIAKIIRKLVLLCSDWPPWAGNVYW